MAVTSDLCSTDVKKIELQQTWVINNYELCSKLKPGFLSSAHFSDPNQIYIFLLELSSESLYLRTPCGSVDVSVEFYVSIHNTPIQSKSAHPLNIKRGNSQLLTQFHKNALHAGLSPDGKLTIFCKVYVLLVENKSEALDLPKPVENPAVANIIFDSMQFSDVTLVVENIKFPAHRVFLAASSKVFAAMFDTEMKENRTNQVVIKDIKSNVIQEMLRYIYTGKIGNVMDTMAMELFVAADKYNLENLKCMCEAALVPMIDKENVCDLLVLADLHKASFLKKKLCKFISSNLKMVINTAGWINMNMTHPGLLAQVHHAWAESQ